MAVTVLLESETSAYEGWSVVRLVSPYSNRIETVKLYPHKSCPNDGRLFTLQEAWSNDTYCLDCDYSNRYSIGD